MKETAIFYPASLTGWRNWLVKNHLSKQSVWLVFYTKSSGKKTITWSEAVDVALCFGWIDSRKIKIDHETFHQFFSKRKPNSTWSKVNKEKVKQLIESGQMTQAGYESIAIARQNGSWTILDEAEALRIPDDLEKAFRKYKGAKAYFLSLSKSLKKQMLTSILLARRSDTRQKRVDEIACFAGQQQHPPSFLT